VIIPALITVGILGALYAARSSRSVASAPSGSADAQEEAVPSRPLREIGIGYEVILPEYRIPPKTEAAILRVDDVSDMNVSGPIIGYTTDPEYFTNLLVGLVTFGFAQPREKRPPFVVLTPPAGPITVRRSAIQRLYPPGTLAAEIRKAGSR
jgi:hypothetical protein